MQLSIIIINYKTPQLTQKAVASVYESLLPRSPLANNCEVIVVDNASGDKSVARLKKLQHPHYKLVESKINLGFSGGNNLGFKSAAGQYILFLNSDTIVASGALEAMVAYYQADTKLKKRHHLGLLAAQLLNQDGSFQPQGGDLPTLWSLLNAQLFLDDLPVIGKLLPSVQHTGRRFQTREVTAKPFLAKGWVGGTAVMVKRDYLESLGLWDDGIFMYGEDQELSYRYSRSRLRHGILTSARVTHLANASSSSKRAILGEIEGYFYFFTKYKSAFALTLAKLIIWQGSLMRAVYYAWIKKDATKRQIYIAALELVEARLFSSKR